MPERPWPPAILAIFALLLLVTLAPGTAAADDMAVKMQWDETLYRDEVSRVNLEITNINNLYPMNVTSAGVYIDWMKLGTFGTNTSSFLLQGGESKVVSIVFRVPIDARYGNHSDYVVIKYTLQDGPGGGWTNHTFESTVGKDFTVVKRPAPNQDRSPQMFSDPVLIIGLVVAVLAVAGVLGLLVRRMSRKVPNPYVPPPEGRSSVEESPPPPPPEETRPEGPEECPFCGAPNPGKHCEKCGWDLG